MNRSRSVALTLRIYRALANSFPSEFRNVYGDEMMQVAEDAIEPVWRRHGVIGLLRLLLDIAKRLPAEYASEMRRDVRVGLRMLAAAPGFTSVAVVSLSLGIGIATCAYSEMNGLLRDTPGVADPERLITLQKPVSFPSYKRFSELNDLFTDTAAYVAPVPLSVSGDGRKDRIWAHLTTASYFHTLGAEPALGRFFDASHVQREALPAAVISHRFWEAHLVSDPAIVGKTIRLNGHICTIIGVTHRDFLGASPALFPADVWLPVTTDPQLAPELGNQALDRPDLAMFQMLARLRPEVTDAAAQAALNTAAEQMAQYRGVSDRERKRPAVIVLSGGKVIPLRKQDVPYFRQFLLIMGGLVLVIACANIANMMLARAAGRRREIAVRLAMGASRGRLIRQLLTESFLLAAGAALPAYLLCFWIMRLFSDLKMPLPIPVAIDLSPDWRALLFLLGLTAATALVFGLAPALQATRTDLAPALKEGGGTRLRKYRVLSPRNALMFCQMAASLMLLVITGYMGLGIQSTLGIQQGFEPRDLYLVSVDPIRDGYPPERSADLLEKLVDRVSASPAVRSVCLTDTLPASVDGNSGVIFSSVASRDQGSRDTNWARKHIVGRGYFETAGIRILSGREFNRHDERDSATGVIVSQEAVRRFWNGDNPVGRRIELNNGEISGNTGLWPGTFDYRKQGAGTFEVVGVAADVSEDIVASKKHAAVYFPLRRSDYATPSVRGVTLMIRATPGGDVLGVVRREMETMDSRIAPFNARSMSQHISQFMSMLKAATWTYGVMGMFGLVLASIGLAGVTAYSVAKRGHEIGIRVALGAQKRDVLRLVMKEGAVLVFAGSAAGLLLAIAGIRALSGVFFTVATVRGYDPLLLIGAPSLLAAVALVACYVPARRAALIDPAVTLRMD